MWSGWSLLGSYICFITTRLTTVDRFITVILYNLSLPNYCYLRGASLNSTGWLRLSNALHCTVQYLKYEAMTSIIGRWIWEPGWCLWSLAGLLIQYIWQLNGSLFRDHSAAVGTHRTGTYSCCTNVFRIEGFLVGSIFSVSNAAGHSISAPPVMYMHHPKINTYYLHYHMCHLKELLHRSDSVWGTD